MKITTYKVTRIELEPGDTNEQLYEELGNNIPDDTVSVVDGTIEIRSEVGF